MQIDNEVLQILNEDLQFATISDALCTEITNTFKAKYAHLTGSMAPKAKVEVDNDHIYCEFQVAINGGVALVYDEGNRFKIISEIDPAGIIKFPKDFDNDLEIVKFVNKSEPIKTLVDSIFNVILEANEEFDNLKELYGANESINESVTLDQVEVGDIVEFNHFGTIEHATVVDLAYIPGCSIHVKNIIDKYIAPEEVISLKKSKGNTPSPSYFSNAKTTESINESNPLGYQTVDDDGVTAWYTKVQTDKFREIVKFLQDFKQQYCMPQFPDSEINATGNAVNQVIKHINDWVLKNDSGYVHIDVDKLPEDAEPFKLDV